MACDTFLKIAQKCKRKFMTLQLEEHQPFILQLISDISKHTKDLHTHQVQSFYESVACMLSDKGSKIPRDQVMLMLTGVLNTQWRTIMSDGANNMHSMFVLDTIKEIQKILKMNCRICAAAGSIYVHQLSSIFNDMLNVYRLYSGQVTAACAAQGEDIAPRLTLYKAMRSVKSEILELLSIFFENCEDVDGGPQVIIQNILPPLMSDVLQDYQTAPPLARDAKVLTMFATAISVLKANIASEIPRIMDATFEPSLQLITTNMTEYPEHRVAFFKFLRETNKHCFTTLAGLSIQHQKLVVDSIVWAFKHTERNISEMGLEILQEMIQNVSKAPQDVSQPFYQHFLLPIIQDVMGIMTDGLHKSGYALQATILKHLFHLVQMGHVSAPLYDASTTPSGVDNAQYLKDHVGSLLMRAFPNLTKNQVVAFVLGLFDVNMDLTAFKQHLRDFLVNIKEFAGEDVSELYIEEKEKAAEEMANTLASYRAAIPGMLAPSQIPIDPDDI